MNNQEIMAKLDTYIQSYEKLMQEKIELEEKLAESEQLNAQMVEKLQIVNNLVVDSNNTLQEASETIKKTKEDMDLYEKTFTRIINGIYNKMQSIIDGEIEHAEIINTLQQEIEDTKKSIEKLDNAIK